MKAGWWVAFVVVLSLTCSGQAYAGATECSTYMVVQVPPQAVVRVPDGDTFHVFTFGVPNSQWFRVANVNTIEKPTKKKPAGQQEWDRARQFTIDWLARGPFTIRTCGVRTVGRLEAIVERNGETLASALIQAGHHRPKGR